MKVLCYGVRDVELPFFNELNKKYNYDIKCIPDYLTTNETAFLAKGFDAVMLRGNCFSTKEKLDIYKSLNVKYILTRTVGTNHIDIEYAKSLGFKMAYVPFYSPNAIAELAVTLAMSLLRHTTYTTNKTSNYNFKTDNFMFSKEIRNCKVGILGLGRIGFTAAKLFKGLGATVLGYDVIEKDYLGDIVTQTSLEEIQKECDIISIHLPYLNEKIITKNFIDNMKDGAIIVNTGRGEVLDTEALIEAIKNEKISGCGLDTIDNESDIFFKEFTNNTTNHKTFDELVNLYPKVLITPHIGSYTDEAVKNMIETSYENLYEFINTNNCKNEL